ncbi:type II toxin-antitoxin system VapB family antitoxin [Infirmifilum lucidum]
MVVRVPREVKERMKSFNVNWNEEIRKFILERIRSLELLQALDRIERNAEKRRTRVDSARLIREDRDRR